MVQREGETAVRSDIECDFSSDVNKKKEFIILLDKYLLRLHAVRYAVARYSRTGILPRDLKMFSSVFGGD